MYTSLSLETRDVERISIFLLSLFLLFRLYLFALNGQAAEVLIHFLQTQLKSDQMSIYEEVYLLV